MVRALSHSTSLMSLLLCHLMEQLWYKHSWKLTDKKLTYTQYVSSILASHYSLWTNAILQIVPGFTYAETQESATSIATRT